MPKSYGTTQTYEDRGFDSDVNLVSCPCCKLPVDAGHLKFTYFGFTKLEDGKIQCHVCQGIIDPKDLTDKEVTQNE
ncbi:unnamed protein product [marine sediment metagenome]|uniref:Uncharacterized protein n=1 Tax=marine sediment metagenome TaxID=412755 RepID=X0VHM1_9ZZZZ